MIFLTRDTINNVILTLTEKVTITASTPYFLFSFTNDDTNVAKLFSAPDTSLYTSRFNQFSLTVTGGTESLTGGTIDISDNGYWKYIVYEMTGQTNLDISGTTSVVENGKMFLCGTTLPITSGYTSQSNTKIVYQG